MPRKTYAQLQADYQLLQKQYNEVLKERDRQEDALAEFRELVDEASKALEKSAQEFIEFAESELESQEMDWQFIQALQRESRQLKKRLGEQVTKDKGNRALLSDEQGREREVVSRLAVMRYLGKKSVRTIQRLVKSGRLETRGSGQSKLYVVKSLLKIANTRRQQ